MSLSDFFNTIGPTDDGPLLVSDHRVVAQSPAMTIASTIRSWPMSNLGEVVGRSVPKGEVPPGITPEKIVYDHNSLNYPLETP